MVRMKLLPAFRRRGAVFVTAGVRGLGLTAPGSGREPRAFVSAGRGSGGRAKRVGSVYGGGRRFRGSIPLVSGTL